MAGCGVGRAPAAAPRCGRVAGGLPCKGALLRYRRFRRKIDVRTFLVIVFTTKFRALSGCFGVLGAAERWGLFRATGLACASVPCQGGVLAGWKLDIVNSSKKSAGKPHVVFSPHSYALASSHQRCSGQVMGYCGGADMETGVNGIPADSGITSPAVVDRNRVTGALVL